MRSIALIFAFAATSVVLMLAFGQISPNRLAWLTSAAPPEYRVAAEIDLITLDGESLSSDELRGEICVLDFWATWCGPCIAEIDDYNDLQRDYGDKGVRLAGVALQSGTTEELLVFASEFGIDYPVAIGSHELWRQFGPTWGLPTTLLIDREWRLRRVWTGAGGRKIEQLRDALDALLMEDRQRPDTD